MPNKNTKVARRLEQQITVAPQTTKKIMYVRPLQGKTRMVTETQMEELRRGRD